MTVEDWILVFGLCVLWLFLAEVATDAVCPQTTGGKVICFLLGPVFVAPVLPFLLVFALLYEGCRATMRAVRRRQRHTKEG